MKVELLCVAALFVLVTEADEKTYTTRYDHLNVDDILYNNRLLKNYYKCLIGTGTCTAEGSELKRIFPDALKTRCRKCTPFQKKNSRKVIEFIMKYKPEMWKGILDKYDPDRKLTKDILSDPNFLG